MFPNKNNIIKHNLLYEILTFIYFSVLFRSKLFIKDFFESLFIAKSDIELIVIKKKTIINDILKRFSPMDICLKLIPLLISFICL